MGGNAASGGKGAAGGCQAKERCVKRGWEKGGGRAQGECVDGGEEVPGGNVFGNRGHRRAGGGGGRRGRHVGGKAKEGLHVMGAALSCGPKLTFFLPLLVIIFFESYFLSSPLYVFFKLHLEPI